jgi:hypothetical protein
MFETLMEFRSNFSVSVNKMENSNFSPTQEVLDWQDD